jgi:C-terminal processing protease CtpA/Prc
MRPPLLYIFLLFSVFLFSQTSSELQKLEDFAKLYGIVRYFHPSDEAAELDWNAFAVYGVGEILKTKNQQEFREKLQELFLPVAPSLSFEGKPYQWDTLNLKPVFWIHEGVGFGSIAYKGSKSYFSNRFNKKNENTDSVKTIISPSNAYYTQQLSNKVLFTIPTVIYTDKKHTLPEADNKKLIVLNENLKKINPFDFNHNVALANIIIMWNVLYHFFPYQEEIKINWDHLLKEGLKSAYNNQTEEEHLLTLRKFTEVFQDGHVRVLGLKISDKEAYAPPVSWRWIGDKLVINKIMNGIEGITPGCIIKKINGQNSESYIDSTAQYISASPHRKQWKSIQNSLRGAKESIISLILENGKKVNLTRTVPYIENSDFYDREDTIVYKQIGKDILYLNMDKLTKVKFYQLYKEIKTSPKLILDLRGAVQPKGGANSMIYSFFSTRKKYKTIFNTPVVSEPGYDKIKWKGYNWDIKYRDKLDSKIIILIDERSISASEAFCQYVKENYRNVIFLGHPTAGANGHLNSIKLLDGFVFGFTGEKAINPDGSQFFTIGVIPDIYVDYTIEGIKQGKDPFIEKAVEVLNTKQ